MFILGLNNSEINASAALLKDGKVIAGAPEERFNRIKRTKIFPKQAIDYCLSSAGIKLADCDYVAQSINPGALWAKFNPLISNQRVKREDLFYTLPDNLYRYAERTPGDWVKMDFSPGSGLPPVYYVTHHRTHAANAFFLSPYEEAAILTSDWRGEFETTTVGLGRGNAIEISNSLNIPHSLGMFYATFTELLGYRSDDEEWKVMALSAFDVDCKQQADKIRSTVKLLDNGMFALDESYYKGAILDQPSLFTPKLVDLLGGRIGQRGDELNDWALSTAKAMQMVSEEIAVHMLKHLHKTTKCDNVVLGGGFFMNCVFNGKVLDQTPFKNLYVSYAPADVGNSMGAALYVAHCIHNQKRDFSFNSSYIGPDFTNEDAEQALKRRRIPYVVLQNPEQEIAKILSQGNIVAHCHGRMEFGDRALGNRSILADPRPADMKDKVNSVIKYRESYRPFAPATLTDKVHEYFEVNKGYECNYMEKVALIRKEWREKLKGVTHMDGSGRVQTVSKKINDRFYGIISEFEKLTGVGVVLNTSLNVNGEPIALSPDHAISTFFNSGLEYLVVGNCLVKKSTL